MLLFRILFLVVLSCSLPAWARETISFDLDETLISSANMLDKDLRKAEKLGYKIQHTPKNRDYIIRPGAVDVLKYTQNKGYRLIIITHNREEYALDILDSSGLRKYFDEVRTLEDMQDDCNKDQKKYPLHRNFTFTQPPRAWLYTTAFLDTYLVRGFQNLMGNKNIQPYVIKRYCYKYPPIYGSRLQVDNSSFNVRDAVDFVGLKVDNFYGTKLEPRDKNGELLWAKLVKDNVNYMSRYGWKALYKRNMGKAPQNGDVAIVSN